MKRLLISIIVILSAFMLYSCAFTVTSDTDTLPQDLEIFKSSDTDTVEVTNDEAIKDEAKNIDKDVLAVNNDMEENIDINENEEKTGFVLKAIVKAVNNEHIEVEVIDSDYAFGTYWILTSSDTKYYNKDGSEISRNSIKVGDTVEITYSGQTMLSFPPQVVAYSIKQS